MLISRLKSADERIVTGLGNYWHQGRYSHDEAEIRKELALMTEHSQFREYKMVVYFYVDSLDDPLPEGLI